MDKKEQTRLRVQRYRDKQNSVTDVTQSPDNVTQDVTQYPAYLYALADIEMRAKLRLIRDSLKTHGVLREVRYGVSGPTFDVISELLEVVK